MYQYLLGKVSTIGGSIHQCQSKTYQYLLGKVSTYSDVAPIADLMDINIY